MRFPSCIFLRASLLLSRYDTANEYITVLLSTKESNSLLIARIQLFESGKFTASE